MAVFVEKCPFVVAFLQIATVEIREGQQTMERADLPAVLVSEGSDIDFEFSGSFDAG